MASRTDIRTSLALSGAFFVVLVGLVALSQAVLPDPDVLVEPVFVAIALTPAVVYLAVSGRLQSLRGGGFEITLRKQAEKVVDHERADQQLAVDPEKTQQKQSLRALMDIDEANPPTTLTFTVDRWGYYSEHAIERYLEVLSDYPEFQHVVFNERGDGDVDRYTGHVSASAFRRLMADYGNVVDALETSAILQHDRVRRESVPYDATNREALGAMDDHGVTELAVTGPKREFIGFVTQDEIVRRILADTIQAV